MTTGVNQPGFTHTARSGTNLANFIQNQLNGGAVVGATVPTINGIAIGATTPSTVNATFYDGPVAVGLSGAGTSSRTSATALTNQTNVFSTVASNSGCILPLASVVGIGGTVKIFNNGAHPLQVYGAGSDTIDTAAATTGVPLTNAARCQYIVTAAATWISALFGAVSA